jgi:hypothetical protein
MTDGPRTTEEEVKAGLTRDGFLAPELNGFRQVIIESNPLWFDYARRLNRVAVALWLDDPVSEPGVAINSPEPVAVRLFARAMNSFQGAVILLERGMTMEAGGLARAVYETAFWIGYLSKSPAEAIEHFEVDDLTGLRGRLRALSRQHADDPALMATIKVRLREVDALLEGRSKPLRIDEVAERAGFSDFFASHRVLSGMAAHASVASISHYLNIHGDGTAGHAIGPDVAGLPEKITHCCRALLMATDAYARICHGGSPPALIALTMEMWSLVQSTDYPQS